jgi:glycosyltransferase involved in cell wall biosynthesis
MMPLVSTVIPVFNRPALLREAVASVLAQTHRPIDVVIVDDGSTDGETPRVAAELADAHPAEVRCVRQANAGAGAARNTGLRHARGEFIQYLDSDDLLLPQKFERQVRALREHLEADVCYGITLRRDPKTGEERQWARTPETIRELFPEFLMRRGWDTNAPLWRRGVCDRIGPWGDFRVLEDWEHDLRAGMLRVTPVHVAEPLAVVRDHSGDRASGMTTGFTAELTREFFRAHRSICRRMQERGLRDWSYLESFSRKLFWIARMCGERGLIVEADEALHWAEEFASTHHPPRDIRLFRRLTRLIGWSAAVKICEGASAVARKCLRRADV